ncbi:MAG: TerB N-terminal domain-containing protein [Candidatus Omnitrophota bacterium]
MEWFFIFIIIIFIVVLTSANKSSSKKSTPIYPSDFGKNELKITVRTPERWQGETLQNYYEWTPPGTPIQVGDYQIPDGMVYCGRPTTGTLNSDLEEPSFINTNLSVQPLAPDREGKNLNYWPSYSKIPPTSRAAYLEWLAGGRKDPNINIGYVFIFFYGLERRLFSDARRQNISKDEIAQITNELIRLRELYGKSNGSFNHYVNSLIEFVQIQHAGKKFYNLDLLSNRYTYEIPPIIKLALGQMAIEGKPLNAAWVYHYATHHPEIILRTPATRCPEEFKKLYLIRYQKKFNDGMIITPTNNKITFDYHYASSNFNRSEKITFDIPDISKSKVLFDETKSMVAECQDDLDKYSRWLGQSPKIQNSIVGLSLLPKDLIDTDSYPEILNFKEWIFSRIKDKDQGIINNKDIFERWELKNPGKFSKQETLTLISFLEKIGVGIEPDVRFDAETLKDSEKSVIFRLSQAHLSEPSQNFLAKRLLLFFGVLVAKADKVVAENEHHVLLGFIDHSDQLNTEEKLRMKALLEWLLNSDPTLQSIKKRLESIDQTEKRSLSKYLIAVAGADNYISPEEIKILTKLYKILEIEEKELYSDIHFFEIDKKEPNDEPVTIRNADKPGTGYSIPKLAKNKGLELDHQKISSILQETSKVAAILKDVFESETKGNEVEESDVMEYPSEKYIPGLDANHMALLYAFQTQKVWARTEFENLTGQYDLLPDGAIDLLNEKSFELFEEPICEGDDPIEINQNILEEFLK